MSGFFPLNFKVKLYKIARYLFKNLFFFQSGLVVLTSQNLVL